MQEKPELGELQCCNLSQLCEGDASCTSIPAWGSFWPLPLCASLHPTVGLCRDRPRLKNHSEPREQRTGWGGRKAWQVPAIPLLELLPLCNAVIPFLSPGATEHGNGKSGLDGRHWTVAERTASSLGQRSWALLSLPWGWVDTGEAGVDLGEG